MNDYFCIIHDSSSCNECVSTMRDLESKLSKAREALNNIRKHMNIVMRGEPRLSTIWNIAEKTLQEIGEA